MVWLPHGVTREQIADGLHLLLALPVATSVSPAMTARRLSIQSTTSFGSLPGNASTPTGSRSLAENRCAPR
jgi:hypothetical protein